MISNRTVITAAMLVMFAGLSVAAPLLVMDVRGTNFKQGNTIDSAQTINLKEGERLTLIGANGSTVTLRGPYSDVPMKQAAPLTDNKQNLTALVASRDARTSAVGIVRAGADEAALPEPWLMDVARSGKRCLQVNATPVLWRQDASQAEVVSVSPSDRSWRLDLEWSKGANQLVLPTVAKLEAGQSLILGRKGEEVNLTLVPVPQDLPDPLLTASWLLHRGCVQQSNAMIQQLSATLK